MEIFVEALKDLLAPEYCRFMRIWSVFYHALLVITWCKNGIKFGFLLYIFQEIVATLEQVLDS